MDRAPIAPQLVQEHIEQAAARLAERRADALFVFRRTNILAFCGVPLEPSDRLVCGFVHRDGQVGFVVPAFEAENAATLPPGSQVATWEEHEDPFEAVKTIAKGMGIERGRIILDKFTWLDIQTRLAKALPQATLEVDSDLIEGIRMIKSAGELEAMRAACEETGRIYGIVAKKLRAGVSEIELRSEVIHALEILGVNPFGDIIQGGESASVPHQPTGSRVFRDGDAVIVDFVAARGGYLGDMTRTFAVDGVSEEIKAAYRVVRAAQAKAISTIRPGLTCEAIDAAARSVIETGGLGDFFVHRLGHGIGMDVHEPPYFARGNKTVLRAGMCLTVEPGVYLPGQFGIRIEDVIAVTSSGCEVLTRAVPTDVSPAFTA